MYLKWVVDSVFLFVISVALLYIFSDVFGLFRFSSGVGAVFVRLFFYGVPLSFLLSLYGFFAFDEWRFKWYLFFSIVEILIASFIFLVIYKSQI